MLTPSSIALSKSSKIFYVEALKTIVFILQSSFSLLNTVTLSEPISFVQALSQDPNSSLLGAETDANAEQPKALQSLYSSNLDIILHNIILYFST